MTRFHIRAEAVVDERVIFDAEETHHLARVLRLRPGDLARTVDGRGQELTVRLTRVGPSSAEGAIVSRAVRRSESPLDLTLVQGLPKGGKMEIIVRMATELGVCRVVPVTTDRVVVRAEPSRFTERLRRWQRIAKEAAKQSGRAVIPEVLPLRTLDTWLHEPRPVGLLLCLWESEGTGLAALLPAAPPARATLIVGPEGGLTEHEVQNLRAAGALVAGLGPRILRTETAGPVGLALLQARWGDLGTDG